MDRRAAWWDFCFAWFRPCPLLSVVMYPFVPKTSHPINPLQPNPTLLARHSIERTPFAYPSVDRLSPCLSIGVAVARRASCRPFTSTDTAETNHFSHQSDLAQCCQCSSFACFSRCCHESHFNSSRARSILKSINQGAWGSSIVRDTRGIGWSCDLLLHSAPANTDGGPI